MRYTSSMLIAMLMIGSPALPDCPDVNADGIIGVDEILVVLDAWGTDDAIGDLNQDGIVNTDDLLYALSLWGPCKEIGACWLPNNTCDLLATSDCLSAGGYWTKGTCQDSDGDRIPDVFELGDCRQAKSGFTGTDPLISDTDGDGLHDGDEVYGTTGGLDLSAFGCKPCRLDILVEADWFYMASQDPDRNKLHINQVNHIINAFSNGVVQNVDGSWGVTIHIDYGQAPYNGGNSILDPNNDGKINMDNWTLDGSEYQAAKDANFDSNRHGYFHYCILADAYSVGGTLVNSSGLAELPGDDFVVTMGQWALGDTNSIGNTFMHELGHNLNLKHGGFENRNFKPNYNSVMNYWYQMCGVDVDDDSLPDQVLDYSRGNRIDLFEKLLDESLGVTGSGPPIDWNQNQDNSEFGVQRNINCRITNVWANSVCGVHDHQSSNCGSSGWCDDSACDILMDHNDWLSLSYTGILESDLLPREIIHCRIGQSLSVFPRNLSQANAAP